MKIKNNNKQMQIHKLNTNYVMKPILKNPNQE